MPEPPNKSKLPHQRNRKVGEKKEETSRHGGMDQKCPKHDSADPVLSSEKTMAKQKRRMHTRRITKKARLGQCLAEEILAAAITEDRKSWDDDQAAPSSAGGLKSASNGGWAEAEPGRWIRSAAAIKDTHFEVARVEHLRVQPRVVSEYDSRGSKIKRAFDAQSVEDWLQRIGEGRCNDAVVEEPTLDSKPERAAHEQEHTTPINASNSTKQLLTPPRSSSGRRSRVASTSEGPRRKRARTSRKKPTSFPVETRAPIPESEPERNDEPLTLEVHLTPKVTRKPGIAPDDSQWRRDFEKDPSAMTEHPNVVNAIMRGESWALGIIGSEGNKLIANDRAAKGSLRRTGQMQPPTVSNDSPDPEPLPTVQIPGTPCSIPSDWSSVQVTTPRSVRDVKEKEPVQADGVTAELEHILSTAPQQQSNPFSNDKNPGYVVTFQPSPPHLESRRFCTKLSEANALAATAVDRFRGQSKIRDLGFKRQSEILSEREPGTVQTFLSWRGERTYIFKNYELGECHVKVEKLQA